MLPPPSQTPRPQTAIAAHRTPQTEFSLPPTLCSLWVRLFCSPPATRHSPLLLFSSLSPASSAQNPFPTHEPSHSCQARTPDLPCRSTNPKPSPRIAAELAAKFSRS